MKTTVAFGILPAILAFGQEIEMTPTQALDDRPLATSGRILLLGLSQSLPAGCTFSDERCETVTVWGPGPMLVRRLAIDIALRRSLSGFSLYPLLPDGTRLPAAPLRGTDASGAASLRLDTEKALAWELVDESERSSRDCSAP